MKRYIIKCKDDFGPLFVGALGDGYALYHNGSAYLFTSKRAAEKVAQNFKKHNPKIIKLISDNVLPNNDSIDFWSGGV